MGYTLNGLYPETFASSKTLTMGNVCLTNIRHTLHVHDIQHPTPAGPPCIKSPYSTPGILVFMCVYPQRNCVWHPFLVQT